MTLPVEFLVDGSVIGRDTFHIFGPSPVMSPTFSIAAGPHALGARTLPPYTFAWPDTSITVTNGETITRTLPFYCS